jgi:hypothetical protein
LHVQAPAFVKYGHFNRAFLPDGNWSLGMMDKLNPDALGAF